MTSPPAPRSRLSLVEQMTLVQALYSLVLASAVGMFLYHHLTQAVRAGFEERIAASTQDLADRLSFYVAGRDRVGLASGELAGLLSRPETAYVRVLDRAGVDLFSRVGRAGDDRLLGSARRRGTAELVTQLRQDTFEIAAPVFAPSPRGVDAEEDLALVDWSPPSGDDRAQQVGTLVVAYNLEDQTRAERAALTQAGLVASCILFFGLSTSYLLGRSLGAALGRIAGRAQRLADGELVQEPLPEEGPGELRGLAQAFNIMMAAIEEREARLREYSEGLEAEVERRTRQLKTEALRLGNANDLLQLEYQRAQAADRAKTEFLATMSHELRTPLNSIIGFSSLLLDETQGSLTPHQREDLETVGRSARHLLALINDLLDLSKVEAGQMVVVAERVPVGTLASEIEAMATGLPRAPGVRFSLALDPTGPAPRADPKRLLQVALNHVSNALKFTERGTVEVLIGGTDGGQFRLRVRDTGPGIAADRHEDIFAPFTQIDQTAQRSHSGTGLGLSISRKLSLIMGGELAVESVPGRGSTFTLVLPTAAPPAPTEETP